jgi:hypothetical protein
VERGKQRSLELGSEAQQGKDRRIIDGLELVVHPPEKIDVLSVKQVLHVGIDLEAPLGRLPGFPESHFQAVMGGMAVGVDTRQVIRDGVFMPGRLEVERRLTSLIPSIII